MKDLNIVITGASSGIGAAIKNKLEVQNSVLDFSRTSGYDLAKESNLKKLVEESKKSNVVFLNSGIKYDDSNNWKNINDMIMINYAANVFVIESLMEELITSDLKIVVTLSTASFINGVYEAQYNATKKALKEFIISKNTELTDKGSSNKIFMFVPHKINGTKMTGGIKDQEYLDSIVDELISSINKGENEYIPKYNEIYKAVFDKYKESPYEQGADTIKYRKGNDE